jgi:hypothetical protein
MTPINLNRQRKAKQKAEAKAQADANATRFGQTKAERLLLATQAERASARLDMLKFDDE